MKASPVLSLTQIMLGSSVLSLQTKVTFSPSLRLTVSGRCTHSTAWPRTPGHTEGQYHQGVMRIVIMMVILIMMIMIMMKFMLMMAIFVLIVVWLLRNF